MCLLYSLSGNQSVMCLLYSLSGNQSCACCFYFQVTSQSCACCIHFQVTRQSCACCIHFQVTRQSCACCFYFQVPLSTQSGPGIQQGVLPIPALPGNLPPGGGLQALLWTPQGSLQALRFAGLMVLTFLHLWLISLHTVKWNMCTVICYLKKKSMSTMHIHHNNTLCRRRTQW